MSTSPAFAAHVTELLAPLGKIYLRKMFGGAGVYLEDIIIALIVDEQLYLKTDADNRHEFEAVGSIAFSYQSGDKLVATSYWRAPDEAMDAPALMLPWARSALAAALRKRGPKEKPARKKIIRTSTASSSD